MASPSIDYAGLLKTLTPGSALYSLVSGAAANPNATPQLAQEVQDAFAGPYLNAAQTNQFHQALASGAPGPVLPANYGIPSQFVSPPAAPGTRVADAGGTGLLTGGGMAAPPAASDQPPAGVGMGGPVMGGPIADPGAGVGMGGPVMGGPIADPGAGDQPPGMTGGPILGGMGMDSTLGGGMARRAVGDTPQTTLPINLGGLNLGSLNSAAILPALFGTGLGLWNMLASQGDYTKAGDVVNQAEQNAGNEVNTAAGTAASGVTGAASTGNALLDRLLQSTNGSTTPYQTAGSTAAGLINSDIQPGAPLNPGALTGQQILDANPGYQFQLGEGERQIEAANAAKGLTGSGPEEKELLDYSQGVAQQAENNAFQQEQTGEQNLFQRLASTAGIGETGVGQGITSGEAFGTPQASNLLNAAGTAGGFNMAGSQYQGNAGATGAGAVAGGLIDANQARQNFIQQILSMIPALFNQNGSGGGGVGTGGLSLSDLLGPYLNERGLAPAM